MKVSYIVVFALICALLLLPALLNPRLDAYLVSVAELHDFSELEFVRASNQGLPNEIEGLQTGVTADAFIVKYTFKVVNNSRIDVHGYGIFSPQLLKNAKWTANTMNIDCCPLFISPGGTSLFEVWCEFEDEYAYLACKLSDFVVYSAHSHTNPGMVEKQKYPRAVYSLIGFGFAHVRNV